MVLLKEPEQPGDGTRARWQQRENKRAKLQNPNKRQERQENNEEKTKQKQKMEAVAICLNGEEIHGMYGQAYEDRWGIHPETLELHAFVRGQRQGRLDYYIADAAQQDKPVYFYTREKATQNLIFRGIGKVKVERERMGPVGETLENNECALFYLHIAHADVRSVEIPNKKVGVLQHFGVPNSSIMQCFYRR